MSDIQINLICCTQVICNEIERGVAKRDIALTYALAVKSQTEGADLPDWKVINEAIVARWGRKGLEAVKKRAWQLLTQRRAAPTGTSSDCAAVNRDGGGT